MPAEIRTQGFTKSFKGYNPDQVDEFLLQVAESYETVYSENAELSQKMDLLIERIDRYRQEEDTLKFAIINAQKMGDTILKDAKGKAQLMLRDAEIQSEKILERCKQSIEDEREEYQRLQREISQFRHTLMGIYKSHIEQIRELPAFEEESFDERVFTPDEIQDATQDMAESPVAEEVTLETAPENDIQSEPEVTVPEESASMPVEQLVESTPASTPEQEVQQGQTVASHDSFEEEENDQGQTVEFKIVLPEEVPPPRKGASTLFDYDSVDEKEESESRLRFGDGYDIEEEEGGARRRGFLFGRKK